MKIKLQDYGAVNVNWIDREIETCKTERKKYDVDSQGWSLWDGKWSVLENLKKQLIPCERIADACYEQGFNISGEGWNGEDPFQGPTHSQEEMYNKDKHEFLNSIIEVL